jgi:hypothetical protein
MFHDIAWESSWKRLICRVHLFHDGVHAISCSTHILFVSTMISTLYRGTITRIIKVNPFHDDTTADEKYQFTYSVVERINFSDRNSVKCEKHVVPSVITNNDIY